MKSEYFALRHILEDCRMLGKLEEAKKEMKKNGL
jgi:hypothetical protein